MRMIYPSQTDRVPIKVVNASGGGLKLSVPEFVAPGAVFQILLEGLMITAEVRYCLRVGNEQFRIFFRAVGSERGPHDDECNALLNTGPIIPILGMHLTQVAPTDCDLLRSNLEGLAMEA